MTRKGKPGFEHDITSHTCLQTNHWQENPTGFWPTTVWLQTIVEYSLATLRVQTPEKGINYLKPTQNTFLGGTWTLRATYDVDDIDNIFKSFHHLINPFHPHPQLSARSDEWDPWRDLFCFGRAEAGTALRKPTNSIVNDFRLF